MVRLYEFIRNKVLNANDFFDNGNGVVAPSLYSESIWRQRSEDLLLKDKLFFFGAYEGFRLRKGKPLPKLCSHGCRARR